MNGGDLKAVETGKDIKFCVASNLKHSQHCQEAANRVRAVLDASTIGT